MNMTHSLRPRAATGLLALSALAALSAAPRVNADQILVAQTSMISGTVSTVDSFTAPAAGTVTIQLANLPWPTALSSLSFFAGSASQVLASGSVPTPASGQAGSTMLDSFQVSGPGTYFAHVTGTATPWGPSNSLDLGLYSMQVSFAPTVPLPAAAWLLVGGVVMLIGLASRLGVGKLAVRAPAAAA
jgi:hypothetical protein